LNLKPQQVIQSIKRLRL